ncbi:MAG: CCA tRNA nucleotidyltransferase [Lentisphaeria bacterium]|jgi:tRNA nucleotidyltransferase (CCA-adding enzyme)
MPDSSVSLKDRLLSSFPQGGLVQRIAERLHRAGGRALVVGGAVRDALLGLPVKDMDLEVYGMTPEELQDALAPDVTLDLVGASFGVFKVRHADIDIALPRRENKIGSGHRGFLVRPTPDLSIAEAAARRDITINAIQADPLTGEVIDPWNGRQDLADGIIRHVSDHFSEDALRVLRVMQFSARFDFDVAPETVAFCRTMRQEELPQERLAMEWEKLLLKGVTPSRGLRFLQDCGWLRYYPELAALVGCPQHPAWHPEGDVWTHTLLALDHVVSRRSGQPDDDLVLALAVLCHDFGKPATTVAQSDGRLTSYNHEVIGEDRARSFITRIWRQIDLPGKVLPLIRCHMRPIAMVLNQASDKAYRRLAVDAGRLDLLAKLVECDILATLPADPDQALAPIRAFAERAHALDVAHQPPEPLIRGRDLLARGLTPGPHLGKILQACYEAQLDGDFSDLAQGLAWLDQHPELLELPDDDTR